MASPDTSNIDKIAITTMKSISAYMGSLFTQDSQDIASSKSPFRLLIDFAIKYPLGTAGYSFALLWFILALISAIKDTYFILWYKKRLKENQRRELFNLMQLETN